MTQACLVTHPQDTEVRRLLGRQQISLLIASTGSLTGFFLLLSVVPLYAAAMGTGASGAGLTTGVMLLGTVLLEQLVPRLLARLGYRAVMTVGILLLGLPAIALLGSPPLWVVLVVGLFRGAGLGIVVVVGPALIAEVTAAERRGEGLGLYGAVVGIPPIIGLPLGVWLVDRVGFDPLFLASAVLAVGVLPAVIGLPTTRTELDHHSGVLGGLRSPGLARPTLVFTAVTFAIGVFVTFLPLALSADHRELAAIALLVQAVATPAARWIAGRLSDRYGSGRLLIPSIVLCATGAGGISLINSPAAVLVGMALFGVGFGAAQNVTLTLMFERVPTVAFGRVSALWNLAWDAGMGIGAVGIGLVVGRTGYAVAFAGTAVVLLLALAPAVRDLTEKKSS